MTDPVSLYLVDEGATEKLGSILAATRPDAAIVYLRGDLGAGKTTFSRGFVQGCGHKGVVKSPTYTLIEPYSLPSCMIYHLDLYRLADPGELEYLGMDQLSQPETISLIEWPEKGSNDLPPPDLTVSLQMHGEGRQATLTAHTSPAEKWLDRICSHMEQNSEFSV